MTAPKKYPDAFEEHACTCTDVLCHGCWINRLQDYALMCPVCHDHYDASGEEPNGFGGFLIVCKTCRAEICI